MMQANADPAPAPAVSERKIITLLGLIQFVNIMDFMIVMPLGPDFAKALGIPNAHLGLIGGSYMAASALSGLVCAFFLDRFDRRKAMGYALIGLIFGTLLGGFATGLVSLVAARVIAGMFAGPAGALTLSIIADVVPIERRGRAMGAVMGSFAAASVIGVPAGLELARIGGWNAPFFATAALGTLVAAGAIYVMPSMNAHKTARVGPRVGFGQALRRPEVLISLTATFVAMSANFSIIPNLSAYWQFNIGYPRERLGMLYLVGGAVSFATMRISGKLVDRFGSTIVATFGTALYVSTIFVGFIQPVLWLPVMAVFVTFMVTGTFRMIPMQTLSSRVPEPAERARFMSAVTFVQSMAAAAGAFVGAKLLTELPGGKLEGMDRLSALAAGFALVLPLLLWQVELRVRRKERAAKDAAAQVAPA